ncbi:MAG: fused MFS/spermidine synthase [Thermodesulfobacteriota bacterium]
MSLELLSGRILAPNFGSSIYVWGGIITVFMIALSTGYLVGGRLSIREPSLRKLSLFLLSAALTATPIVIMKESALDGIFSLIQDPRYGSVVSTTLLFFLPTAISGMVSPYAVRLLVREHQHSGHYAGLLFFVSTFGSAAGTILTSFYLVLYLEIDSILWLLIGISSAICIVAIAYGRRMVQEAAVLTLGLIIVFGIPGTAGAETILHKERSLYRDITVYEEEGTRCMRFTRLFSARQTCVSLKNPDHLVINYTKMMLGALYLRPDPRKILMIGVGGGTLPTKLSSLFPAAEIHAVEIDPAVISVAKKYFDFRPGKNILVFEEDGRVFVKRAFKNGYRYDLILLDAFDHEYIPEHLLTKEFLEEVRKILMPGGVLAANTWSTSRLYDHESATYQSVFGEFYNLRYLSRVILVKPDGLPSMDLVKKNAHALDDRLKRFDVDTDWVLSLFSTKRDWRADARVLTDQYSPSNLLNRGAP